MFLSAKIFTRELTGEIFPKARARSPFDCGRATQVAILVCMMAAVTGCKTGSSMNSSWLGLGIGGADPATLAEAPPFEGNTTKPSATAKPYPTTSTPESYALQQEEVTESAGQVAAAAPQAPVTYGSTPVAIGEPAAAAMASATPSAQVGPYQQMPAQTSQPAATYSAGTPPATSMAADTAAGYEQPRSRFSQTAPVTTSPEASLTNQPSGRFSAIANQRVAEAQPTAASATAAVGSRYSSTPSAAPATASAVAAEAGQYGTAPPASRYGGSTASAFGAPGAVAKPPVVTPSASSFSEPAMMPEQPTGSIGEGLPAPPTSRRPDPGYRPGGTSSFRPAQPIYADTPISVPATAAVPGATPAEDRVTPASFEAELGMPRQSQP